MNKEDLKKALSALGPPAGIRFGEPMDRHTSLGIGGLADVFAAPLSQDALVSALEAADQCGVSVTAMGGGTNLLVVDGGISELVVHMGAFDSFEVLEGEGQEVLIRAGSGVRLQQLLGFCRREGISGMEALAGIPGMLGGAVVGNAGSFDCEIKDLIREIKLVGFDGKLKTLDTEAAGFRYRGSDLLKAGVVTELVLGFQRDDPAEVAFRIDGYFRRKQISQPVGERSAGCVFKNPAGGRPAGMLIDSAGCKGMSEGGIVVSPQHANFFINSGRGSAEEFLRLMDKVQAKVYEAYGVELEPEIRVVWR